ncbi:hypothetical protein RUM44_012499 [Polyplax serrata]|uniref:Cilia- and flagella-associated protein 91 n=1 Tax=Polyplax serrata TaxID=468196 RepID=A0ABR1BFD5_POLSC
MSRCRSNKQPYPIYTTVLCGNNIPTHVGYRPRVPEYVMDLLSSYPKPETPPGTMKAKLIQTMFRDSEAQTDPYVVDIAEGVNKGLEILTLGWLSWNHGLPAGINEIQTIERARQKRAWEAALPLPFDNNTKEIRKMIIEAIEINEWNYREQVIAAMCSLRMELAQKLLMEKRTESKLKYEIRLNKYIEIKKEEKYKKIHKLRSNFNRELRKLTCTRKKINKKYHRWDIIRQFTDKTSEMFAPQLRFGENPRHWHEKIPERCKFWAAFNKIEIMHHTLADIPTVLLPAFDYHKKALPRINTSDLCVRSTKWTEQNLEVLHEDLRSIRFKRNKSTEPCYLKKRVKAFGNDSETPTVTGISDEEETSFQACLFLQKTIKGRAIQAVMFEGRVKCQELIEELKSTHALQGHLEDANGQARRRIYGLQRQAEMHHLHEKKKNEILSALEGKTTGDMLDFLSKELLRLQNERMTHAMALMADQERHKREAAEAGRRQLEEQRRREHDEMYKQVVKMYQNTVHSYLDDIFIKNRMWLAQREAREYVNKMAKKIDEAAVASNLLPTFTCTDDLREEEIIADLIHNFALPEVEKQMVRKRLKDKQRNYLKVCHDEVFMNIEKLVQGARTSTGELIPLPRAGKHKIPPQVRVKYRQLKRMHESSSSTDSATSKSSMESIINEQFLIPENVTRPQPPKVPDKEIWSSGFSKQDVILENGESDV